MIDPSLLAGLTDDEIALIEEAAKHAERFKLDYYVPYPRQREFFALGLTAKQRLLTAGNRVGKSEAGAYETACHLTGLYPRDWEGYRYTHPIRAWAAGISTTLVRDISQTKLCGPPNNDSALGTGFIPAHCFANKPTLARGAVSGSYDTVSVYHHINGVRDGISQLAFKSYEQGRQKFQGDDVHFIWWDEEPGEEEFIEGEQRWSGNADGRSIMTFTPLLGNTNVVEKYLTSSDPRVAYLRMSVHDAPHMTAEMIDDIKAKNPSHEWDARIDGYPKLGSGRIFTVDEELIKFPTGFRIPEHWPVIWGIDFGITHPFAAVLAAWDRDTDVLYVIATHRASNALPLFHADAMRRLCAAAPVAWPHDGARREAGSGESLARQYKAFGLSMLPSHAHFASGGFSTEAAVLEIQQRTADGRLRVRADLADWFEEYRMYHRKDGLIFKVKDDLISATQKIIMAKRFARVVEPGQQPFHNPQQRRRRPAKAEVTNPWTGRPVIST